MPVLEPAQVAPVKEVGEDPVTLRVPRSGRAVGSRRKDILQTLAKLLEDPQCDRITTALIAKKLKLSEAALYRSFPSKGAMFDALIGFIESSLLDLFAQIRDDDALADWARADDGVCNARLFRCQSWSDARNDGTGSDERGSEAHRTYDASLRQA